MPRVFEFPLSVGDVTIGLRCWDDEFAQMLQNWCGTFLSNREPDFWLEVGVRPGRPPSEIQDVLSHLHLKVSGGRFWTCPELWEGEISWDEHWMKLRTERELFHPDIQPRFLNTLLASIYNTVCHVAGREGREALLFHGCGIAIHGEGYIFTGPSGAGKTTVARLAGERPVLNDEAVLLRSASGAVSVSGTPLLGGLNRRTSGWHKLQAVLMLKHANQPGLRRLGPGQAYTQFLTQLFDTAPLIPPNVSREGLSFLEARVDLASETVRTVPMYELEFRPDTSFWPLIEQLQGE